MKVGNYSPDDFDFEHINHDSMPVKAIGNQIFNCADTTLIEIEEYFNSKRVKSNQKDNVPFLIPRSLDELSKILLNALKINF